MVTELLSINKRFSRRDKNKFLDVVEENLTGCGYECERKKFWLLLTSVNLETKCDHPDYIFIAHYDTGTIVPFWLQGLMKVFGVNRQILSALIIILAIQYGLFPLMHHHPSIILTVVFCLFLLSFLPIFVPTPVNYDDNTSGVIALLDIAKRLKEKEVNNVKFIFVDNEELGLFGSSAHKRYLKKREMIPARCRVISLDSVGGRGDIPLIVRNGKSEYEHLFSAAITGEFPDCRSINMLLPASDNYSFREFGAINISFVDESLIPKGYYKKDIHSHRDKKIDLDRIERLNGVLVKIVCDDQKGEGHTG
jgi:hypothetical protein